MVARGGTETDVMRGPRADLLVTSRAPGRRAPNNGTDSGIGISTPRFRRKAARAVVVGDADYPACW